MIKKTAIYDIDTDDILNVWVHCELDKEIFREFIIACPAAKAADAAALAAEKRGDDQGRALWDGFLRGLFICAVKFGEIPAARPYHIWTDDMVVAEGMAEDLFRRSGRRVARRHVGNSSVAEFAAAEPGYLLRYAADRLTPERLDACAAAAPRDALQYAAERLTQERLDECACARSGAALRYAAGHLTPERLDACAAAASRAALRFASDRLTPERLDACAAEAPDTALRYAALRLTPERLDACAAATPGFALRSVAEQLSPERLDACAAAAPGPALRYAAHLLTPERLDACTAAVRLRQD